MKKYIKATFAVMMIAVLLFAGCSVSKTGIELKKSTTSQTEQGTQSENDIKTLIIYYSYTGTTKRVAEHLQKMTDGDIYEITLKEPYSGSDNEVSNRVFAERAKNKMPQLEGELPDISSYDRIFIGTPVWNSSMSNPVLSYLEQTDFKGKKVAPFWTYITNQGKTKREFSKKTNNGVVLDGLPIASANGIDDNELDKMLSNWVDNITD